MRYRLDGTVQRFGRAIVGGSPLRLFRLTDAGCAVLDRLAQGDDVAGSGLTDRLVDAGAIHPVPDPEGAPFSADDVTVVVPALGVPQHLPAHSLVVVVDDGSVPPVPGASVRMARNGGPAAARNAGLGVVTTPLVAFVDGDVSVGERWLDGLLAHFADPRVALVAPRVMSAAGTGRLARYERTHSPLDMGDEPARVRAGSRVSYVPAAAMVVRVDALRAVDGFDPTLRVGEDVDLAWRLDAAGWRCRYEPATVVHHEPRRRWREWWHQRVGYGTSAGPLAVRHAGALAPLRMSGWSLAAWVLAALGRPLVGTAVGLASAAALVPKLPDVPSAAAFRLAASGNARAGEQIAAAMRRAWWPIVAVAGLRSRTARKVLLASLLAAGNPMRALDDVAYSVGLWKGAWSARTVAPLLPDVTSWPSRA